MYLKPAVRLSNLNTVEHFHCTRLTTSLNCLSPPRCDPCAVPNGAVPNGLQRRRSGSDRDSSDSCCKMGRAYIIHSAKLHACILHERRHGDGERLLRIAQHGQHLQSHDATSGNIRYTVDLLTYSLSLPRSCQRPYVTKTTKRHGSWTHICHTEPICNLTSFTSS